MYSSQTAPRVVPEIGSGPSCPRRAAPLHPAKTEALHPAVGPKSWWYSAFVVRLDGPPPVPWTAPRHAPISQAKEFRFTMAQPCIA